MYAALVGGFIVLLLTRDTVYSVWAVRASTKLHNALFTRVLGAPMLFFLRTPVGDVLNAFARDQVSVVCCVSLFVVDQAPILLAHNHHRHATTLTPKQQHPTKNQQTTP